ncbi:hypothetical protein SAY87_029783 [Trapa incisa]|uniref:Uncharacterized protein n=1 Tax=Trapa incisa TaxID=236973 RepID=A0AAN7Q9R4_9MYRT|nr:hypothetical protein SAY87_029783 [Trapa incisa]
MALDRATCLHGSGTGGNRIRCTELEAGLSALNHFSAHSLSSTKFSFPTERERHKETPTHPLENCKASLSLLSLDLRSERRPGAFRAAGGRIIIRLVLCSVSLTRREVRETVAVISGSAPFLRALTVSSPDRARASGSDSFQRRF